MVELLIKGKGKQVNVVQGNKESTWSAGGDVKKRGSASISLDSKQAPLLVGEARDKNSTVEG
jgi:hypothetical protein